MATSENWPGVAELIEGAELFAKLNVRTHLTAWDPVNARQAWRVELGQGIPSGVLATAGNLVFQGTTWGKLRAYAATSGARPGSAGHKFAVVTNVTPSTRPPGHGGASAPPIATIGDLKPTERRASRIGPTCARPRQLTRTDDAPTRATRAAIVAADSATPISISATTVPPRSR